MNETAKRILNTCVGLIVTALLGLFVNLLTQYLDKPIFKNENETEIKQCIIQPNEIDTTLDSVGGLSGVKKELQNLMVLPLRHPAFFRENELIKPIKGILFHGPPGTGKTLLAKALAKDANVPLLSLSASSLESKWFGESNKLISSAFNVARSIQPCILFFDEIDGIGKTRSEFDQSCVSTFKTELLSQMDGVNNKKTDSFVIIGCTNNIKSLDCALQRRFSNQYEIKLPNHLERKDILSILTQNEHISDNDLHKVSIHTKNYSGSDLDALYNKVSNKRLQKEFENEDFISSIKMNKKINYKLSKITWDMWKEEIGIQDDDEEAPP
tara:strand:+ start:764 stop:1741 length:978 start_codon:yes stop_codon:yes gene_type:complete